MEMCGHFHDPATLPSRVYSPMVHRTLYGFQNQSGPRGRKNLPNSRAPDYVVSCLDSDAVNTVATPKEPQVLLAFDLHKHCGSDWPAV